MIKRVLKHTFTLLNVDHVKLGSKWNYKNVISPYFRIYYIDEGEGEIWDAANKIRLEPGYLYIIPSFTLCNLVCPQYLSQYFVQFFEESSDGISMFENNRSILKVAATNIDILNFQRLLEINPGRGINGSDNPTVYEKNTFYKAFQDLNHRQSIAVFTETHGILLQLVSRFLTQEVFKSNDVLQVPPKILNTISYIQLNLQHDLSVTLLAQRLNLHTDYFSRLFFQHTGERPVSYVQEKRIERAQYLMITTQMTFAEIAVQTGFENVFYFSKIFKKITGMSPGNYRKQMDVVGF
ncbi:AraC family transcriptional regulator [Chitinophaga sp.]|uniref:helix-turn-helix domain-containing protein n=1 Tax=Chitinophaga sp. TaxID=1869181 RepID=UPI0031E48058